MSNSAPDVNWCDETCFGFIEAEELSIERNTLIEATSPYLVERHIHGRNVYIAFNDVAAAAIMKQFNRDHNKTPEEVLDAFFTTGFWGFLTRRMEVQCELPLMQFRCDDLPEPILKTHVLIYFKQYDDVPRQRRLVHVMPLPTPPPPAITPEAMAELRSEYEDKLALACRIPKALLDVKPVSQSLPRHGYYIIVVVLRPSTWGTPRMAYVAWPPDFWSEPYDPNDPSHDPVFEEFDHKATIYVGRERAEDALGCLIKYHDAHDGAMPGGEAMLKIRIIPRPSSI